MTRNANDERMNLYLVLLWQKICQSSHTILVHYSVCEDSEVTRSRTPIELHQAPIIEMGKLHCELLLHEAVRRRRLKMQFS